MNQEQAEEMLRLLRSIDGRLAVLEDLLMRALPLGWGKYTADVEPLRGSGKGLPRVG